MLRNGFICLECLYLCSFNYCSFKEKVITDYLEICSDVATEEDVDLL